MRIADIKAGREVRDQFLVAKVETRVARTGAPYLWSVLKDSEGATIVALQFEPSPAAESVLPGMTVDVVAEADEYQGSLNLKLSAIKPAAVQWDPAELLPKAAKAPDDMARALEERLDGIEDAQIAAVVRKVLSDPEVAARLRKWPAAKSRHHAVVGGLLEHVLEVLDIADAVCALFPRLDRSLLYAGCILHDIGKVLELSVGAEFDYTAEGVMVGHVSIGDQMVARACAETGCSPEKTLVLRHMVLAHHGALEFGSPVLPKTPEAVALHHIDQISSQIRNALDAVGRAARRAPDDSVSQWDRSAGRNWFLPEAPTAPAGDGSAEA